MHNLFCLLICTLGSSLLMAQKEISLHILDAKTKTPIENAHIFYSGSTLGSFSNAQGFAQLIRRNSSNDELIISHLNYKTTSIASNQIHSDLDTILLNPSQYNIQEVIVYAKAVKGRKAKLRTLKKILIGEGEAADKCQLANTDAIFIEDRNDTTFYSSSFPIQVNNKFLSYELEVYLNYAWIDKNGNSSFSADVYFSDLNVDDNKKIKARRQEIYYSSLQYFLKSLIRDEIDKDKFDLQIVKYFNQEFHTVSGFDFGNMVTKMDNVPHYAIHFPDFLQVEHKNLSEVIEFNKGSVKTSSLESRRFGGGGTDQSKTSKKIHPKSQLFKIAPQLIVHSNGVIINKADVKEYGMWATRRLAVALPTNYGEEIPPEKSGLKLNKDLIQDLLTGTVEKQNQIITKIEMEWKVEFAAPILDFIRFIQDETLQESLYKVLRKKLNAKGRYYELIQKVWDTETSYNNEYFNLKAGIYNQLDSKFYAYFHNRSDLTNIRLDEVVWGGVFQNGIPPLRQPEMIKAKEAKYLDDSNEVYGIVIDGIAKAYPKRVLAWHEMFIDSIGSKSITGVYCTLCQTVIAYDNDFNGVHYNLGTSGFLYRSNKLMFDQSTQSLWNTITGEPVIGPLINQGIKLNTYPIETTTWGSWRSRHPQTKVLSLDTGFDRNYDEGEAYKDYFSTDALMFPVPTVDNRLKNKDLVFVINTTTQKEQPTVYHTKLLINNKITPVQFGDKSYVIISPHKDQIQCFENPGGLKFKMLKEYEIIDQNGVIWTINSNALINDKGEQLSRISSHQIYWFAWLNMYPHTTLLK